MGFDVQNYFLLFAKNLKRASLSFCGNARLFKGSLSDLWHGEQEPRSVSRSIVKHSRALLYTEIEELTETELYFCSSWKC